jgi:putative solute:sodium symporter small subunit
MGDAVSADSDSAGAAAPRRRRFPSAALLMWALFAFAIPRGAQSLNVVDVAAFPLGFFMTTQGALAAFLVIAWMSARRQDKLDAAGGE